MNVVNEYQENEEEDLINQIELEMRKIHLSVERLYNNDVFTGQKDPIEKCLINNYIYSSCLLGRGINDDTNQDALKTLEESLQKELDYLTSDLDRLLVKMNENKIFFDSMDRNISNLSAMMEAQKKDTKSVRNMGEIMKNIKLRFRKERADLKEIIGALFPENLDIRDLIAEIVEHHFKEGSDKYLQVAESDNVAEQIELLRRTNLFEINPHDPLQIRLADLV